MITAIYPGSFDPITYGHLDIIRRAARVFDKLVVGVLHNQSKKPLFTVEEKVSMIREVTADLPNVEVIPFDGLLVDFSDQIGATVIVRGIRAVSDFESELMMAQTNKQLNDKVETMFFATSAEYSFISSSTVKEVASFGGDFSRFLPEPIYQKVCEKYRMAGNYVK